MRTARVLFPVTAYPAVLCLLALLSAVAQEPQKRNRRDDSSAPGAARQSNDSNAEVSGTAPRPTSGQPRFSYEFTQPEFLVSHIVLEHDAAGLGQITFTRRGDADPIVEPVVISKTALGRIMNLWNALSLLESTTAYQSAHKFPHLGTIRVRVLQGTADRVAEFNWTDDASMKSLADEYRRIAEQAILIFEIGLAREHEPLAMPELIEKVDLLFRRNDLSDPRQLIVLLRDITTDERVPLIARDHATRLLRKIEK